MDLLFIVDEKKLHFERFMFRKTKQRIKIKNTFSKVIISVLVVKMY